MTNRRQRVLDVHGYLLHSLSWRETSLIVQIFSRDHGIVSMVAKGAKRPHSMLRPVLNAFQPLNLSWTGAGEVKTLIKAESMGITPLSGNSFMSAWYMNELLLNLLPREDAHPELFDSYIVALNQLANTDASSSVPASVLLRHFEWILLKESGYGFDGEMPDLTDPAQERDTRIMLRERLNSVIGKPLNTRKVMMDLHRP